MNKNKQVKIYSKTVDITVFDEKVLNKLVGVNNKIGIKGGFARELFIFILGLTKKNRQEKLGDLDVVVFETPSVIREERIKRRDEIVSLSNYFDPKDIEFCESFPSGFFHFFRTRDVTMNELLMFKNGKKLCFFFSGSCLEDLITRKIRPSIRCCHTGLGLQYTIQDGKVLLDPSIISRCIYRKVKEDGDTFCFDEINIEDSLKKLDSDALFKIIKRFIPDTQLFEKCICVFKELGINNILITDLLKKVLFFEQKEVGRKITSEIVENILDERQEDYCEWLKNANDDQKKVAEIVMETNQTIPV